MSDDLAGVGDDIPEPLEPERVSGALLLTFGAVHVGREALAVATFTEVSRFLGGLLGDDAISSFSPYFFADGQLSGVSGFFLIEGERERLDALRRDTAFQKLLLRAGAATANVGIHTMVAGTEAGRLVHMYRSVRAELGLL